MLSVLGTILILLSALAIWQRETVYFIIHPDRIQIKPAALIKPALLEYPGLTEENGVLSYHVLENSIHITVALGEQKMDSLKAIFNAYDIPIKTISDALSGAQQILSPYLTPPEIKALGFLIAGELPGSVSAERIDYTRSAGDFTLTVKGSAASGDMSVEVYAKEGDKP